MTDWTSREFTLKLNFLNSGPYEATICQDGINADRYASDYQLFTKNITRNDSLPIKLAPGGGFLVRLKKE
ncbi:glycoside hydrolase family 97 C-terminal domain-containing protein [Adhaeribacter pallidiroseus]|uniref:Alpha-glucosidase n=1 Tax=Adhaeribacter pallidiroseus TaxID=2072847 RepID=A0A369QQT3_9BACT|nr:glycoside hydrolase family 97 C-terminal domain-containing protein [Adhaeribacter pallidiroseus]RDC65199.1 Alpha-glucosidase [Adhaeribacter pallidiroseus]